MKKIFNFSLFIIFVVLLCNFACTPKNRLDSSTHTIEISSSQTSSYILITDDSSVNVQFSATVIGTNGKVLSNDPVWSVSDSESSISSDGLYMAPNNIEHDRKVTITASYDGVSNSLTYNLVKNLPPTDIEKGNRYYMYADITSSLADFQADVDNPGNVNGGYIAEISNTGFVFGAETVNIWEGSESLKLAYENAPAYTGIYFQFGYDGDTNPVVVTDLSGYVTLKFHIYSVTEGVQFIVKIKSETSVEIAKTITLAAGWQEQTFTIATDFPGVNMAEFEKLIFISDNLMINTIYIDNIYFEK